MRWRRRVLYLVVIAALLAAIQPDALYGFQEREIVPLRSLEGEEVPLALCVQAFLKTQVLASTGEERMLRRDGGVDDDEWTAIRNARMETQALYAKISAEHDRHLSEGVKPLEDVDYEAYVAAWDEAGLLWLRQRTEGLARIYAALLDSLDVTTEVAIVEYVQPGHCAGHGVSYNTDKEEFDPETLAIYEGFESQVEENRQ